MTKQKHDTIKEILTTIFDHIDIAPDISLVDEDTTTTVHVEGQDLNFLIGYRGESLEGLQTMLNLILLKRLGEYSPVVVDINFYRQQRREKIEEITRNYIDRARFYGGPVELPPMSAYERRYVHLLIGDYDDIESESIDTGRSRRVVLKPKI